MNLDMQKLEPLLGKVVNEMGAASNGALVILGDKLGLFRALSQGAMTSAELAAATGTHERYVREWLSAQAASGFVDYRGRYRQVLHVARAGGGVCRRGQPGLRGRRLLLSCRRSTMTSRSSPKRSRAARACTGASTATACSAVSSDSSAPDTVRTSSPNGCRPSTAWSRSSSAAPRSPMSAAGTAHPRC